MKTNSIIQQRIDSVALSHILNKKPYNYIKPGGVRNIMKKVFGDHGIFIAEGQEHKKLRKLMTPSFFSPSSLTNFVKIIDAKSIQLLNNFKEKLNDDEPTQLDVVQELKNISTDITGLIGFGFSFDLSSNDDKRTPRQIELHKGLQYVISSAGSASPLTALSFFIPSVTSLPTQTFKLMSKAMSLFEEVGYDMMKEKKEIEKENEDIGEGSFKNKDALSSLS